MGNTTAQRPNIVVVMGDDVGWFNIGAYHRGMMSGRTPFLDRMAREGTLLTDYYAESSCTEGRANFVTGQLPIRTGLSAVGQGGNHIGIPVEVPSVATALKALGYATAQFGNNHFGDRNEFLPTLHGFDEFFGYLYRLDVMEDPARPNFPPQLKDVVGPRNMVRCWATEVDDPYVDARWGRVGNQRIEDAGPLYPKRMETVDDEFLQAAFAFIDRAREDERPFFCYLNPTRMHVVTHLSERYEKTRTPENGWSVYEAGMAQLDDLVGALLDKLRAQDADRDTLVVFTGDNGPETSDWPDGGQTPFAGGKGTVLEGGFRVPCIVRWPGRVPAGRIENGLMSGLDWFPTLVAAAGGEPKIAAQLRTGKVLVDRRYRVHLDGYNQLELLEGRGPSHRKEIYYFAEGTLGAIRLGDHKYRFIDQPGGWLGGTVMVDRPLICNLRLDPFERTSTPSQSLQQADWSKHEFWRFVFVQEQVAKLAQTFSEFPPIRPPPGFNLDAVKAHVARALQPHHGA